MVKVVFEPRFKKIFSKIKNVALREKILKQISKIRENPEIGKPMRYTKKQTRELYIPPYRLSYIYRKDQSLIYLIDLYHKDEQ